MVGLYSGHRRTAARKRKGMDEHPGIVVVCEPDLATRVLYERTLSTVFTVLIAPDDAAILALLRNRPIAAVVVEPALFTSDRWGQLALVSRACAAAGVPLIVCSTQDERRRGRDLGVSAYLVKPTLPAALLETVQLVLHSTQT